MLNQYRVEYGSIHIADLEYFFIDYMSNHCNMVLDDEFLKIGMKNWLERNV